MREADNFSERVRTYTNNEKTNNSIHQEFSELVASLPWLAQHRKFIEDNGLGFGDKAFHYMWYLLLQHIALQESSCKLLEIGVYKGQVISLWKLIASKLNLNAEVSCITPLKGNPLPKSKWIRRWKKLTSLSFREDQRAANFYPEEDYGAIIANLFKSFSLDFSSVRLIQGYSNDPEVLKKVHGERFSIVYIDGDHSFNGATQDINHYSALVLPNGFLVMDDASFYLPGNAYWKGHESVSRACEIIPSLGFVNVLNVGHNRIYQKSSH